MEEEAWLEAVEAAVEAMTSIYETAFERIAESSSQGESMGIWSSTLAEEGAVWVMADLQSLIIGEDVNLMLWDNSFRGQVMPQDFTPYNIPLDLSSMLEIPDTPSLTAATRAEISALAAIKKAEREKLAAAKAKERERAAVAKQKERERQAALKKREAERIKAANAKAREREKVAAAKQKERDRIAAAKLKEREKVISAKVKAGQKLTAKQEIDLAHMKARERKAKAAATRARNAEARRLAEEAAAKVTRQAAAYQANKGGAGTKIWMTRRDLKVRPAHQKMQGVEVPKNEPFDVEGYPMMWPGEASAPIELWARCRCSARYATTARAMTQEPVERSAANPYGVDQGPVPSVRGLDKGRIGYGAEVYTQGGAGGSWELNAALRSGEVGGYQEGVVKSIDSDFAKAAQAGTVGKKGTVVYRGVTDFFDPTLGTEWTDGGYLSTTGPHTSPHWQRTVTSFANGGSKKEISGRMAGMVPTNDSGTVMKITLSKETPLISPSPALGEMLLPRGGTLRVTGGSPKFIDENGMSWPAIVDVEYTPPG